jgi:hypothetical protein
MIYFVLEKRCWGVPGLISAQSVNGKRSGEMPPIVPAGHPAT